MFDEETVDELRDEILDLDEEDREAVNEAIDNIRDGTGFRIPLPLMLILDRVQDVMKSFEGSIEPDLDGNFLKPILDGTLSAKEYENGDL